MGVLDGGQTGSEKLRVCWQTVRAFKVEKKKKISPRFLRGNPSDLIEML